MRRLVKGDKPVILVVNEHKWTEDYLAAVTSGNGKNAEQWRRKEIKAALKQEVDNKCAYCDSDFENVSYMHVEHMVPKGNAPELAHLWFNLTGVCEVCNVKKGSYYVVGAEILNPYTDDLDQYLRFDSAMVVWKLDQPRGEITVRRIDLNRIELVNARSKRILNVIVALERWCSADGGLKETLRQSILFDALEGEYVRSVLDVLERYNFPLGESPALVTEATMTDVQNMTGDE